MHNILKEYEKDNHGVEADSDSQAMKGNKAVFDFRGNMLKGNLNSRTAIKLVREWIDIHFKELEQAWAAARQYQEIKKIDPLD